MSAPYECAKTFGGWAATFQVASSFDTPLVSKVTRAEMVVWCTDQFGPSNMGGRWAKSQDGGAVAFRCLNDATAFRIRWC